MALIDAYVAQLQALLPSGPAWSRDAEATLTKLLNALADELARVDGMAAQILEETDPRLSLALLTDWERVTGLPGGCGTLGSSTEDRRAAVLAQLTGTGGQSKAFFIEFAKALGYDITISEYRPFKAGRSAAGDELTNENWLHRWMVLAPGTTTFDFKAGRSVAGDPVSGWGEKGLECPILARKPAHTEVTFAYGT